jgi:hypothetical protein
MNLEQIENNLKELVSNLDKENFIYDFLLAYGLPKSSINRLKKGDYNKSKNDGEIIWAKKVYFKTVLENNDVHDIIDEISKTKEIEKNKIRFIIVTDFKTFLSKDLKTSDTLDIELLRLGESLNFFLPLMGREKIILDNENPADIKAANQMGKLYDQIIKDNGDYDLEKYRDHLNLFFTRLLFLYYADDSEIFKKNQFLNAVAEFSEKDGSDLKVFFNNLFFVLNTEDRSDAKSYLKEFPYVNGNLFNSKILLPEFSKTTHKMILEGASLDWHLINPDILGSMMQSVVHTDQRSELGMHYTSVQNILKLIGPLFLDNLNDEFTQAENDQKKLNKILKKIYNLIFFDPACGSGNFLVIVFKELCKLEIKIFKRLRKLDPNSWLIMKSGIRLDQFYGIEIDDYAHETAKLSMWIAEHQMNLFFKEVLGDSKPTLPLSLEARITKANAARIDWNKICPIKENKEVLVFGNPPYLTYGKRNEEQKEDMNLVFGSSSKLDYISLWFLKASKYIEGKNSKFAFVSTNSINQGEQVSMLWKNIFSLNLEINFCHKSFKWSNAAKNKAGVTCSIIGISNKNNLDKKIYEDNIFKKVKKINAYLLPTENYFIEKRKKPISDLPPMTLGDMPVDNGNLLLLDSERNELISLDNNSKKFIRKFIGADEFLNNINKWCLWINDNNYSNAKAILPIKKRLDKVKEYRLKSKKNATRNYATKPYRFMEIRKQYHQSIFIPLTTSEKREYLPIGFADKDTIIGNSNSVIYNAPIYLFGIISSKIHLIWLNVSGKMKNDIRYSSSLCYNTFPINKLTQEVIKKIEETSLAIIDEREKYSNNTIYNLYGKNMPLSLKELHKKNDEIIDEYLFGKKKYDDEEKVKILFKLFNELNNSDILL